jgi:hypothetical protein
VKKREAFPCCDVSWERDSLRDCRLCVRRDERASRLLIISDTTALVSCLGERALNMRASRSTRQERE